MVNIITPNTIQIFFTGGLFLSFHFRNGSASRSLGKTSASLRGGALSYQFKCPSWLIARRVIFGILMLLIVKTETESLKL